VLCDHFAIGGIDAAELDRRVGLVLAAQYTDEIAAALAGLPQLASPGPGDRKVRRRGHAQARKPEPGWVPTDERFRDPTSKVIMRVWLDPVTRERHYVPDEGR
jgi:Domain of unknown function (DUF1707)